MNIWYQQLKKPPFTPPQAYFPIAWTILYLLMALSFALIILKDRSETKIIAIRLFLAQLIFNLLWTPLFFEFRMMELALVDVIIMFILLLYTMKYFWKLSKLSAILLIPYLLQVIFAIYLNFGFITMN